MKEKKPKTTRKNSAFLIETENASANLFGMQTKKRHTVSLQLHTAQVLVLYVRVCMYLGPVEAASQPTSQVNRSVFELQINCVFKLFSHR